MVKKALTGKPASIAPALRPGKNSYAQLLRAIEQASTQMVGRAASIVNQALVLRNWLVGAYLVEYEQGGADRAKYGARLIERLATDLAAKGLKGLTERMLRNCRLYFLRYPQIRGALSPEFDYPGKPIPYTLSTESVGKPRARFNPIRQSLTAELPERPGSTESGSMSDLPVPLSVADVFRFSWTHLVELIRVDDPWKRAFYENECLKGNWSVRQLQRQIESLLYERTGLSANKRAVIERGRAQAKEAPAETIADLIRDPYVLEFTGLAERPEYAEDELERALLDHLQRFLLELGAGFCFEARQFRITVNNKHDRVDLVFYHRYLRCHVLLDLKIRVFRHTDAGQMNFYLNWFRANMKAEGDNPPVGIILCSGKDHTEVEFATGGMDNQLFVSRYLTALPSAEQLKTLVDADRALLAPAPKGKKKRTK